MRRAEVRLQDNPGRQRNPEAVWRPEQDEERGVRGDHDRTPHGMADKTHGEEAAVRASAVGHRGVETSAGGQHRGDGIGEAAQKEEGHRRGTSATQRRHKHDAIVTGPHDVTQPGQSPGQH